MPATNAVLNKYGKFRFIDYVSMLPEFLREEHDVVTLMQIYTDYINNAYRNTTEATKFEFRLVATEGLANTRMLELTKLAKIFKDCESRNLPVMYLMNPLNPASGIIDYAGDLEVPPVNIIPGGCLVGDRFYIKFTEHDTRSGVYVVVDANNRTDSTDNPSKLVLDMNSTSQDPFSATTDKPTLTSVGYNPRAIQFYPSDISDVGARNIGIIDGTVYSEVFFSATITDIEDCHALDNYDLDADKFLVDYYGSIANGHPEYTKIFKIHFESSVGCMPFTLGMGIFYAKELTRVDTRDSMVDATGNNRYIDPSYVSKPNTNASLYYSLTKEDQTTRNLRNDFIFWEQVNPHNDSYVGLYANRVIIGDVASRADLSLVDIIENRIVLDVKTALRPRDYVRLSYLPNSIPMPEITNDSTHIVSSVSDDFRSIVLEGLDIQAVGSGGLLVERITFTDFNVGHIVDKKSNSVVFSSYCGDMITGGDFVVRKGKYIVSRYRIINDVTNWNDSNSSTIYYVGDLIHYTGIRYRVTKAHVRSEISGSPESEHRFFVIDMASITDPTLYVDYNPYMFGSYRPRRMAFDQHIDYHGDGLDTLYDQMIIQPIERVGEVFKHEQRDWIFNPRFAHAHEFSRNGWMTIFKNTSNLDTDIANPSGANQFIKPIKVTALGNRVCVYFDRAHRLDYGNYIEVRGAEFDLLNGTYPIVSVLDAYTIVYEIREAMAVDREVTEPLTVSLRNADHITNGSVLFSRQNLCDVSVINPAICPDGNYYKYTMEQIDWSKSTIRKVPTINGAGGVGNIETMYGEFSVGSVHFIDGMLVNLINQSNRAENGYWRVKKNALWIRCDAKITMKIGSLIVDAQVVSGLVMSDTGIFYTRYTPANVSLIANNAANIFVAEQNQIVDFRFARPAIADMDTNTSHHVMYDARLDSNTMASKPGGFEGVPDMRYPIAEKIERLAYMKDPNIIDIDLIGYLARFMGYDVSPLYSDIQRSDLYKTTNARENALRKLIQMLPEFNAIKSTEGGLNTILLTFGLVSKVMHMWTEQSNPYAILVPDVDIDEFRYSEMNDGRSPNMVATPHFMVRVEVDGNFAASLTQDDIGRARSAIINYKPINTVFNGMEAYLRVTAGISMSISPMNAIGRMQADIGYVIDYDQINDNCAI